MDLSGLSGFGTELGIINTILIILAGLAAIFSRYGWPWQWGKKKKRNNNSLRTQKLKLENPDPPPGQSPACIDHGKQLTEIETKLEMHMKNCDEEFSRIRERFKELFQKYDKIKK